MVTSLLSSATPEALHGDSGGVLGDLVLSSSAKQGLPPSYHIGMPSDWEAPLKGGPPFLLECLI